MLDVGVCAKKEPVVNVPVRCKWSERWEWTAGSGSGQEAVGDDLRRGKRWRNHEISFESLNSMCLDSIAMDLPSRHCIIYVKRMLFRSQCRESSARRRLKIPGEGSHMTHTQEICVDFIFIYLSIYYVWETCFSWTYWTHYNSLLISQVFGYKEYISRPRKQNSSIRFKKKSNIISSEHIFCFDWNGCN